MFWDRFQGSFINKNNSEGSYNSEGNYVVWPLAITAQAVVDSARIFPDETMPMLKPVFQSFEKYYSPKRGAYCASYYFEGNDDVYYDDNAQIASAFLTAFEVTKDRYYLDKGLENVNFLMTGEEKGRYGGVKWHVAKEGSTTCTTAEVGIACLRAARFVEQNSVYVEFAKKCADWIFERVKDSDGLICDGLVNDDKGGLRLNEAKWTYNQGTPITLCCLLYAYTQDDIHKQRAEALALATTDHNTAIFDRDTLNMDRRYYRDSTFFYQLLAEGLADFLLYFGQISPSNVVNQVGGELLHTIQYVYKFLRDPSDGLYWQTFELNRINKETYQKFQEFLGENKQYTPNPGEREKSDKPVEERRMTKVLIGCGSAARIFFQTARVYPKFSVDI